MSLNEVRVGDLGGFGKIERLFWGSFGLPKISGNFEGCPLDFGGFQRIPGISEDFEGFYRILLIFEGFCLILRFSNI